VDSTDALEITNHITTVRTPDTKIPRNDMAITPSRTGRQQQKVLPPRMNSLRLKAINIACPAVVFDHRDWRGRRSWRCPSQLRADGWFMDSE
jgi:hypothetical protein